MINPAIIGPAAGMVVGGIGFVACVCFAPWRKDYIPTHSFGELVIATFFIGAFAGGFLGYKSVAWLGLVAP